MANNYGIVSNKNTPSQETVDGFLNWCDANPPEVDIEGLTEEAKQAVMERLQEIQEEAQKKLDALTSGVKEQLDELMSMFGPLASGPSANLQEIKGWLDNLAAVFKKPYDAAVAAYAWWETFTVSAATAVSGTVSRTAAQLTKISSAALTIT